MLIKSYSFRFNQTHQEARKLRPGTDPDPGERVPGLCHQFKTKLPGEKRR